MACPLHKSVSAGNGLTCSRPLLLVTAKSQLVRGDSFVSRAFEGSSSSTTVKVPTKSSSCNDGTIRVNVSPPREVSQPPAPPSLIHSPVYVQKALIKPSVDSPSLASVPASPVRRDIADEKQDRSDSNSLLWALKQVDRSLDELEVNPLPLQREIYELSRSPVGTATSSALTTAARVTMAATKEAVRAAVPLGQWAVREGTKAAISLVSRAMAESAKQQQGQKTAGAAANKDDSGRKQLRK